MLVGASWPSFIRTTYCSMTIHHYVFYLAACHSSTSFAELVRLILDPSFSFTFSLHFSCHVEARPTSRLRIFLFRVRNGDLSEFRARVGREYYLPPPRKEVSDLPDLWAVSEPLHSTGFSDFKPTDRPLSLPRPHHIHVHPVCQWPPPDVRNVSDAS